MQRVEIRNDQEPCKIYTGANNLSLTWVRSQAQELTYFGLSSLKCFLGWWGWHRRSNIILLAGSTGEFGLSLAHLSTRFLVSAKCYDCCKHGRKGPILLVTAHYLITNSCWWGHSKTSWYETWKGQRSRDDTVTRTMTLVQSFAPKMQTRNP